MLEERGELSPIAFFQMDVKVSLPDLVSVVFCCSPSILAIISTQIYSAGSRNRLFFPFLIYANRQTGTRGGLGCIPPVLHTHTVLETFHHSHTHTHTHSL